MENFIFTTIVYALFLYAYGELYLWLHLRGQKNAKEQRKKDRLIETAKREANEETK